MASQLRSWRGGRNPSQRPEGIIRMARDSIELSAVQSEMLLFFAGRRTMPCGDSRTTLALSRRELLSLDTRSGRYEITEFGQHIADQLDHEPAAVPTA
jgi:hypothetical protein